MFVRYGVQIPTCRQMIIFPHLLARFLFRFLVVCATNSASKLQNNLHLKYVKVDKTGARNLISDAFDDMLYNAYNDAIFMMTPQTLMK